MYVPEVSLQFGHLGCIQAHRHTWSSSCVTHLSDHSCPLFLVIFIPERKVVKTSLYYSAERAMLSDSYVFKIEWKAKIITYCQMSMISLGAHSLSSFSTMAKPPIAYSSPPQLTRLTELLSWGNSVKGDHLWQDTLSCITGFLLFKSLNECYYKDFKEWSK